MRILVLGGDGMLGHQLLKQWSGRHEVGVTVRSELKTYRPHGLFTEANTYALVDVRFMERILEVLAEFRPRIPEIEVHLHATTSHRDAAAIIAQCDLLLSERLHALVMAAILGKPFVALMYDVKVRELVASLGMEGYAFDINHPFDPLALQARCQALQREAGTVGCHLAERSAALRRELDAYFASLEARLAAKKGRQA